MGLFASMFPTIFWTFERTARRGDERVAAVMAAARRLTVVSWGLDFTVVFELAAGRVEMLAEGFA